MSAFAEKARYGLSDTAVPDWAGVAASAWEAPSWKEAAADYHKTRNGRPSIVEIESEKLSQLRRLMADDVSLDRVWDEVNRAARARYNAAPQPTVEALMMGLRERGIAALLEPKVRRRLSECNEQQVAEVGNRLQKLKPEVLRLGKDKLHRGWTAEEVEILLQTWGALR
jgi:hypothetical protein